MDDLLDGLDFDPDAVRERYRVERDKRLRDNGADQYIEMAGEFARFAEGDPHVEPGFTREPIVDEIDIAIIGGGFSGLLAAARLTERGITSFRIIEAGGDFGGTWYWNRYPGAQCDTDAYCYLPLLEELGYVPKEKYAYVNEIFEHSQRIGRHYDLYERAIWRTRVRSIDWDDDLGRWHVSTDRDDDIKARFVVMALGTTTRAKLPGIPGIETFEGHAFHTSRWDYGYTGGDTTGGMAKLADKRVAVIGTGATAIQCVPRLAADAGHLYVFQRTPSTVDWRRNRPTDPEWFASLEPGWQRRRRENFTIQAAGVPVEEDLIDDGWTQIFRAISSPKGENRPKTQGGAQPRGRAHRHDQDGGAAPPRRRRGRGPGRRRGAEAVVPGDVQAADVQRRVPAVLQPRQRHARRRQRLEGRRADHADAASWPTASSTRWTSSSTPPGSRSRPSSVVGSGWRSTVATASRCSTTGPTG